MGEHLNLGQYALASLKRNFTLIPNDIGADARLSKMGITFLTETWNIQNIGHLCIMRMNSVFNLMKMETIVIAPTEVDAPIVNLDWVKAMGTETQIAELYDTQLQPWPEEAQEEFRRIAEKNADLEDYSADEHWYDSLMYPCSIHKKGKGITNRLNKVAGTYIDAYAAMLTDAVKCPAEEKIECVKDFAHKLVESGGSAVNTMTRLFGDETTRRMVLEHMYGV